MLFTGVNFQGNSGLRMEIAIRAFSTRRLSLGNTARKRRFYISRIKNELGGWIEELDQIKDKFVLDFSQRFSSCHNSMTTLNPIQALRKVTAAENLDLIKLVTASKFEQAIFQMNPHKTPRLIGFGACFFQKFWPHLKDQTCLAIQDFFHSGKLLKELNHTLIALIPKTANPETTSQFRSISLCSTFYKIIAKILVNRIRPILERLV